MAEGGQTIQMGDNSKQEPLCFDAFAADLRAGELRKHGVRLKLSGQPFQILSLLLEKPGEVVTREELRAALWPGDTFVDFEHSLNAAVNKLREALGDSAENPRYVETLPRRGYRFIGHIHGDAADNGSAGETQGGPVAATQPRPWAMPATLLAAALLIAGAVGLNVGGLREKLFGAPAPKVNALAVLPFANLSNDPEQEYFADGMTEELISQLAQIGALRVTSRTSAMRYKDTQKALPEIGRELGVPAVVEGSVMRVGERVRISAQLVDAATDQHLWAGTYERDLRDVLALQREVARAISEQVRVQMTPQEQAQLAAAAPVNPQAYEAYLKGKFHLSRGLARMAVPELLRAVELDPNFAPAHAALAEQFVFLLPSHEMMPRAREAALRAIALDQANAEAHMALALVKLYFDWDWPGAEQEFRRALELDPGSATVHARYNFYLWVMGRFEEAVASAERARQLDPLNVVVNTDLGRCYYFARQYDRAIEQFRKTLEIDPNNWMTYLFLGIAYEQAGMQEQAAEAVARSRELASRPEQAEAMRRGFASSGFVGHLRAWAKAWEVDAARGLAQPYSVGLIYTRLGEKDLAFRWLEKAFEERTRAIVLLNVEPQVDPIRDDPRFYDLVRRIGLPKVPAGK